MDHVIQAVNLSKTYHLEEIEVRALQQVNFVIERGEFVAVMGASGSGKSTLMNLLGCLDRPTSGRYLLEGIDVAGLDEQELARIRSRRIGFIFQNFNLLSRTTTLENIELPLFYSGWPPDGETRAQNLIDLLGLSGRERNHPSQLSGGQQQRAAIARALINQPSILLADEPTGNLDSHNSVEILEIIKRLNRERGLTVIVVTHDADVAAYADRVITFRDGEIVSDRAAHENVNIDAMQREHRFADSPEANAAAVVSGLTEDVWMFAAMALSAAARTLQRNKLRAALTMLGIFIGVAAVIAMVAVGNGARYSIQQQIESLGTNLLVILPGATTSNGVRAGFGTTSTLSVADAEAIAKEVDHVAAVSYTDRQVAQVVYGDHNWSTSITGTTPAYLTIRNWQVERGRPFTDEENKAAAPVCLVGQTVVNNLFAEGENPLGATIRVKNFPLKIVGVMAAKGQSTYGQDQDDVVFTPFFTAERKVLGTSQVSATVSSTTGNGSTNPVLNPYAGVPTTNAVYATASSLMSPFGNTPQLTGVVNMIYVQAASAGVVDQVQSTLEEVLHRRHRIQPTQPNDFTVRSLNEIAEASEGASRVMTLLLAAVASISLLVGGIGIMNIMLVSVTERTREIGIRMAIGARRIHILLQFLVESSLLSILGGAAGVLFGIVVSKGLSAAAQWPTLVSLPSVIGGFVFAAAVGVFFGWYPARTASLLDPIEALRYE
ncbi:MAG TPA: ABC transporter permease [Candidatus Binataceae bacterium]|nr:ABC transporter permease [Candidatus Binataceae bacterium]